MSKIISYDDAIKLAGGKNCTLLLGNGFSIKYFNYKNLLEKADLPAGDPVRILFDRLGTVDFERVVKTLEDASVVERAYGNDVHSDALVIPNCVKFLTPFENVFTMNYDLLLYWVTLGAKKFNDGFGLGTEENGYLGPFKEGAYCNVYNVHGGLHLFQRPDGDVEKRLMGPSGVIDAIAQAITAGKRFPVYVAEGTSLAKLRKIDSIPYLRYCYETLRASSGPFFIYGHSADPNDAHIYDTLFRSNIAHLYFCIHQPSAKIADIDGELARYQKRNGSKIGYTFVDSESVHVWGR